MPIIVTLSYASFWNLFTFTIFFKQMRHNEQPLSESNENVNFVTPSCESLLYLLLFSVLSYSSRNIKCTDYRLNQFQNWSVDSSSKKLQMLTATWENINIKFVDISLIARTRKRKVCWHGKKRGSFKWHPRSTFEPNTVRSFPVAACHTLQYEKRKNGNIIFLRKFSREIVDTNNSLIHDKKFIISLAC